MSKSTKALTELIKQMDTLLPTLAGKDAANILVEKSSVLRDIAKMEQATTDDKAKVLAEEQAKRIVELTSELTQARERIKILERTSLTRMLEHVASSRTTPAEAVATLPQGVVKPDKPIVHEPAKPTTESELRACGVPMPDAAPVPLSPPKKEPTPAPLPTPLPEGYDGWDGNRRLAWAKASTRGTN